MTAGPTRKQKQKRRRRAVFLLLLAAVLCGVGFYCACVFCRASHIEVTGSTRYTAEDIIEAAGIGEEQNLFTVSQKALNQKITALCPYIESVTLHRRLPDTLELELHEFETIYACIGSMGRITTLSADAKVLEQCASLPEYTCLLLGADFSGYIAGEKLPEAICGAFPFSQAGSSAETAVATTAERYGTQTQNTLPGTGTAMQSSRSVNTAKHRPSKKKALKRPSLRCLTG